MILSYSYTNPDTRKAAFIAQSADIIGNVTLGENSSVWFNVTIRADFAPIKIGAGSNVQDNAVVHVDVDTPTTIGDNVTIGHGAIIHACTIGNNCLIGMGSIVLNEAVIPDNTLVGAGALIPPGKTYPEGSLLVGSPAKAIRKLNEEELDRIRLNAEHYVQAAKTYQQQMVAKDH